MKYLISIEYDGSKFYGLQKLKSKKTIQGELEKVLAKMNDAPVRVFAAGRTDKGVHALDQKCHFELTKKISPFRLRYYLNRMTAPYIYVKECKELADQKFHSRFSVKSKTYLYKINTGPYSPIQNDYLYNYNKALNIKKMNRVSKLLEGGHNFKAFVVGKHKTYDTTIDYIKIKKDKDIVTIKIKGQAFYTYMVRNIVYILILVSENKITNKQVKIMLSDQIKPIEYSPAPSSGLYLLKVEY